MKNKSRIDLVCHTANQDMGFARRVDHSIPNASYPQFPYLINYSHGDRMQSYHGHDSHPF
ncbi:hypothetical protein C1H46_018208 [Malus baccata]|uniref:Uncharacterized protein n=1 Tax=Malus baccata TaxID=106549 RepID=A0A540MCL7_MALBA|nr:hypothetical protein C1H46_018208 [Malus baccata]